MYNISDTDLDFKQLLEPKLKEFEGQFEKNMFTQEATLELIYEGLKHSDVNDFKNNKLVWNAACYVNIVSYDLKVIGKNLTLSKREWEKRYFARQAGLLIYEASSDLFELLGKEFRAIISDLTEHDELKDLLKNITRELNSYKATYQGRLQTIRNVSIAHRDKNALEQLSTIYSISWVEAINYVSGFDKILNLTGQFLQKVLDKSVTEFRELKGT